MGIGEKITGALKSGVARLEATQKKLEPYEREIYEKAKGAAIAGEHAVETGVRQAYKAEKQAFPGQVKTAKRLAKKARIALRQKAGEAYEFEKKAYPTQKKLAQKGIEFIEKGFEEAYGKGGMFGGANETLGRGTRQGQSIREMGDESGEDEERPVQRMRRAKRLRQEDTEEGPRNYIDEYMSKFEDEFWAAAEETRGEDGAVRKRKFKKEPQTPVERYLKRYEEKMSRRGL